MENAKIFDQRFRSGCIILLYLIFFTSCNAQVAAKPDSVYSNQIDSTSGLQPAYKDPLFFIDGQLCQHLRKIFQDSQGNLWFGTNIYGMMKYDGNTLKYFDKEDGFDAGRVTGIVEDDMGYMWISSYQGLIKYDGTSFIEFPEKEGFGENELWSLIMDSKGILWVGTNTGVSRFDGKEFSPLIVPKKEVRDTNSILWPDRITSIAEDQDGNLWFGTDGFGICKYDGKSFTNFTTDDGLCDNTIHELMVDSRGNLWIGTFFGGLSMYDGTKFTNFTKDNVISGVEVCGFYEDKDGNIWFAVENNGVYKYDGKTFTNLNEAEGLLTNGILSIFEDKEGRFWFGGWGGLFRYDGRTFYSVTRNGPWEK